MTYSYDAVGHPLTMSDATGSSSFAYNGVGRLVSETNGAGASIGYAYDNVGQLTTISYPGARIATYDYDAAGQMTSLTDWSSNETTFSWTVDGQLATQATPDSVTQTNSYDLAGQLTGIAHATPTDPLAEFTYGYDFAGQLVANSSTLDGATIASDYGYDPISQLTAVTTTPSGGSATVANPDATPAGLLTTTVGGAELDYNAAQQVTSFTPVIGAATDFGYDARGSRVNATTGTEVTAYAYTASGALASVTTPSRSVSYTSDARNLRQARTVGGVTQQFTWSSVGALPLLLDDAEHSYLYGASSTPIAQVDDTTGEVQYLHADLLGTPRLVTDDTGDVAGTVSFDAFGTTTTHTGVQSAFGFTGNLVDAVTGLLYLRARDYDPATGQFLTVDPAVDTTRQPYAYTGNNPVSRTDPTGLDWQDELLAVGAGALDGLTGGLSSMILSEAVPGYDCFIQEHNTAFQVGSVVTQVVVAAVVIIGTMGAGTGLVVARYVAAAGIKAALKEGFQFAKQFVARTVARLADDTGSIAIGPGGPSPIPSGPFFRGAKPGESVSFRATSNDYRVDAGTGLVKPSHGVSIFDNVASVQTSGRRAFEVDLSSIPKELSIVQRGRNLFHYEIVPAVGSSLTADAFNALLSLIRVK